MSIFVQYMNNKRRRFADLKCKT